MNSFTANDDHERRYSPVVSWGDLKGWGLILGYVVAGPALFVIPWLIIQLLRGI